MYFTVGWPRTLSQIKDGRSLLKYVSCNRYRMLFAVLTEDTVSIWHCRPCVEILCYKRSRSSVAKTGCNSISEWKHDSSMLAIATTTGYLLVYQLEQDVKSEKGINLYEYNQNTAPQGENTDGVPALRLCLKASIQYSSPITSITCVNDELLISTLGGELELIPWFGTWQKRKLISVQDMTFSVDLHSAGSSIRSKHPIHVINLTYSPCLEGFTAVFSDGRAALIFISKQNSEKQKENSAWKVHGIWATGLTKAVCNAVNNRYRLMAFGTARGSCEVYSMDDVLGSLQFSHQMSLSPKYYPDVYRNTGSVLDMKWSPDGCALALTWVHGGFSLWSVYGSCLVCTLSADHAFMADGSRKQQSLFHSLCWGAEGYQLWMVQENVKQVQKNSSTESINHADFSDTFDTLDIPSHLQGNNSSSDDNGCTNSPRAKTEQVNEKEFVQMHFIKSALTMNPCSGNHFHVILQGEDRVFISFGEKGYSSLLSDLSFDNHKKKYVVKTYITRNTHDQSLENIVGNKQWTILQLPLNYLNGNWPIRFSSIDKTGKLLAIAGNFGIAHYSFLTRKWKLFGNIMQEKDMVVTGGLTWWQGLIIVACYNLVENQDELRIYPHNTNLDNVFAYIKKIYSQVLLINVYQNMLIVFDATCHVKIFQIKKEDKIDYTSASLTCVKEISLQRYVPYPSLVVSVMITSLHMESSVRKPAFSRQQETEVLIVNVAGRLLLFQHCAEDVPTTGQIASHDRRTMAKDLNFQSPIVLASSVENIWTSDYKNSRKVHLTDALWLSCGSAGVRVWLPLFPPSRRAKKGNPEQHDMQVLLSKRITLTLEMDTCYPLAVLFENAVVIGVKSESFNYQRFSESNNQNGGYNFPFSSLERTCEIYLHQILRQLLRRNLGYHALQVAASCQSLSYFPHVLELMLHKVLEEEATASEPIPDPLLPTIVKFIAEFPEYLETIVHCARKTEIALWQYLFNSVGNPKELFEECLETDQLETAASYLIILQNLEKLTLARQDATRLLSKALQFSMWTLAADIIRFLRAIGDGDATTSPRHPVLLNSNIYPAVSPTTHLSIDESTTFNDKKPASERNLSAKANDNSARHPVTRSYSNFYDYSQKSSSTVVGSPPLESSTSYHPYVPQYPMKSFTQRHRGLHSSLSHPAPSEYSASNKFEPAKLSPLDEQGLTAECAEHYFIDVILSRQARQLLSEKNLKELATFAVVMDFELIPWLKKERNRAARVTDAVECLGAIHRNFELPYPKIRLEKSQSSTGNLSSSRNAEPRNSDGLENDDSISSTGDLLSVMSLESNQKSTIESYEISDSSSINEDVSSLASMDSVYVDLTSASQQVKQQLNYLFEIMLQSYCVEWAFILCFSLRDTALLSKVLSLIKKDDGKGVRLDSLQRMRDMVTQISKWVVSEAAFYEPLVLSMQDQFSALNDIVNAREIEYAEQQALLAQQKASHYSSESMDRTVSSTGKKTQDEGFLKHTKSADSTVDDVFDNETISSAQNELIFSAAEEESAADAFSESNSASGGESVEDETADESCAIS